LGSEIVGDAGVDGPARDEVAAGCEAQFFEVKGVGEHTCAGLHLLNHLASEFAAKAIHLAGDPPAAQGICQLMGESQN